MVKITQNSKLKTQNCRAESGKKGSAVIAVVVGVVAFIFFAFAIVYYQFTLLNYVVKTASELLFGGGTTAGTVSSAVMQPVDCTGVKIPKIYLPVIKQNAKRFLGGDEAIVIALISIESDFNYKDLSSTGAVGIAQFTGPTARDSQGAGMFKGLKIITVPRANFPTVTPAEKLSFLTTYPYEGRLQPSPSIEASAHKIGSAIKKYGGLREGYAQGYHRFSNETEKNAAYSAADKLTKVYNKIKSGGGCKELKGIPGKLGEDIRQITNPK